MRPFPVGAAPDALGFADAVVEDAPGERPRAHLVLHPEAGVLVLWAGRWKLIEGTEGPGGRPPLDAERAGAGSPARCSAERP